jgi:uncharacterized membrane protein
MNIIDILINLIVYVAQNWLLPILPAEAVDYPLATLQTDLDGIVTTMTTAFGGWGVLFPVLSALTMLTVIIIAEITLFAYRIIKYIIEWFKR